MDATFTESLGNDIAFTRSIPYTVKVQYLEAVYEIYQQLIREYGEDKIVLYRDFIDILNQEIYTYIISKKDVPTT